MTSVFYKYLLYLFIMLTQKQIRTNSLDMRIYLKSSFEIINKVKMMNIYMNI